VENPFDFLYNTLHVIDDYDFFVRPGSLCENRSDPGGSSVLKLFFFNLIPLLPLYSMAPKAPGFGLDGHHG
jgi:hypothetical protein